MRCEICGGYVEWKGRITNLTHTECAGCGAINSQEAGEPQEEYYAGESETLETPSGKLPYGGAK